MKTITNNLTGTDNLKKFCELNNLPQVESWLEVAELLNIGANEDHEAENKVRAKFGQPQPETTAKHQPDNNNLAAIIAAAIAPLMVQTAPPLDEEKVKELIQQFAPRTIEKIQVTINDTTTVIEGRQHKKFPEILDLVTAGLSPYLYGPAGTGKTQIAENIAKAMNRDFYFISVCSQSTKSDFLGYMTATGTYSGTHFRTAYEKGGVYLIDEIDNGNANILSVLNSALANGCCAFPDAMIKRHKDFVCIAAANTFGTGADRQYIGRNPLDAASLNRFTQSEIGYDEDLEIEIFGSIAEKIQAIRHKLSKERVIVSMRNISQAKKLLAIGYSEEKAIQIAVINTIPENLRSRL